MMAEGLPLDPEFMSKAKLWLKRGIDIQEPVAIAGFPGIGRVGELVTNYFLKSYSSKFIGMVTSPYFSTQTIVDRNGIAHILGIRMYKLSASWAEDSLLVVKGDQHQETMGGEYESCDLLLRYLGKRKAGLIVTIGGMYSSDTNKRAVYVFASEPGLAQRFRDAGALVAKPGVPVVGAAGIMVGLAGMKKIPSACLLGETSGDRPDVDAAKRIVPVIGRFFGFEPDMQLLNKEGAKIDKIIKIYEESYAKIMQNPSISKIISETKGPEYVS